MMLYISVRDHARKLKFNIYVYLPSINKMFSISLCLSDSARCSKGIIFDHGCYISALANIRMLILSICVLLECIYKHNL